MTKFLNVLSAAIIATVLAAGFTLVTSSESFAEQSAWGANLMRDVQKVQKFKSFRKRSGYRTTWKACKKVHGPRVARCLKWYNKRKGLCARFLIAKDHAGKACR